MARFSSWIKALPGRPVFVAWPAAFDFTWVYWYLWRFTGDWAHTGYDFGANRDTRKMVAWGGTTPDDEETGLGNRGVHRVWFYDLSAGPENWGGNWNVDDADLDGDDVADYRIPVSWEYGGYRKRSALPSPPRGIEPWGECMWSEPFRV